VFKRSRPTAPAAADLDAREELARLVNGTCCRSCGALSEPVEDSVVTRSTLRGPAVYGECVDCSTARRAKRLERHAAALILNIPEADRALTGIKVEAFSDLPHAHPSTPNPTPWAHLSLADLAVQVEENRADIAKRTGGPCAACGINVTPYGRFQNASNVPGVVCEACYGRLWQQEPGIPVRSRAAAIICGLSTPTSTMIPLGFAKQVGFEFWADSNRTEPNEHPFGHLSIKGMRARTKDLVASNQIGRPSGRDWDPTTLRQMEW